MGNMLRLEHRNDISGFTREFTVETANNRLRRTRIGETDYNYSFDAGGNMRSETTSRHFEWNHSDQMKAFRTQTDGAEPSIYAHYLYDAAGQRAKKLVRKQGGQIEVTHYVDGMFEHHRWASGTQGGENNQVHVMDDMQRVALVRIGVAHPDDKGPAVQFQLSDHLGSSNVVADSGGALVNREEFTPYGETSFGSFAKKRYRFTGMERDEESGLSYHGKRCYVPALTRWANCDPAGIAGGQNAYAYVLDNPLRLTDHSGMQPENLPQDAQGNYLAPGETIRIHVDMPPLDELDRQKRAGLSHYDSRAEVERQLLIQIKNNKSDYSWQTGPPEPDWDAEGFPELAEEARAEADAKWDAHVTKEYQRRRTIKELELADQQRRVKAANTAGKVIVGGTAAGVALVGGAAVVGVGTGLKASASYFLGTQLINPGATALAATVAYGIATPPGAPNIPGPGDEAGHAVRGFFGEALEGMRDWWRRSRVIKNPTWPQIRKLIPPGHTIQSWGGRIWGGDGPRDAMNMIRAIDAGTFDAATLRGIPGLTVQVAKTLRNWMNNEPAQNTTAPVRVQLLNRIITLLGG